jgi:FKBP-type peptidyl-prolyl cis-trans isomerase
MPKEADSEAIGEQIKRTAPNVLPGLLPAEPTAKGEVKTTISGVKYETIKEGTGPTAKAGQRLTVHYVGTLDDGRKFDSSRDSGKPFPVEIGTGKVIKGWDEAIPGMKVGEVRKLTIPPTAGYGAQGSGERVPPNATLHFEVELISAD